jgi:hypothetical protein
MRLSKPTPVKPGDGQAPPTLQQIVEEKPKPQWQAQAAHMNAWLDHIAPGAAPSAPSYSPKPTLRY